MERDSKPRTFKGDLKPGNRRAPPKRKPLVIALCLVLLVGGSVWMGIAAHRLWTAASAVRTDLVALESLAASGAQALALEEAIGLLHTTRTDLETLQATARPFLWLPPYLGWLPRYGPDIQAAPLLLKIALSLTAAGEEVMEPLRPLLNRAADQGASGEQSLLGEAMATLKAARLQLMEALSAIEEAQAARTDLKTEGLSPRVQGWVTRLDQVLPLLEPGIKGTLLLPELLGADGSRTYLVLVQNEDELRATGGFISGVAQVTVEGGNLLEVQFEDSYAIDDFSKPYPDPPVPLLEYMLSELWVFRDSNWSPHFPTSAQTAISLYTISQDVEIDGVIALDQQAIRLLVEALEPLQVAGYPEPVTGENVIVLARQAWAPGDEITGDWWRHRKDFMDATLDATIRRAESGLDQVDAIRLAHAVLQALEQKHLLVYLQDQEAATLVTEMGWDGGMVPGRGDFLMVVDTNMGFNKVNALVEETLEYVVDLTDLARPYAILTVHHRHPLPYREPLCRHEPRYDSTYEEMMERCYWDYLRVYVPLGTQLVNATPHSVSGSELLSRQSSPGQVTVGPSEQGHDVFATFLLLRTAETLETRFEYLLPPEVLKDQGEGQEYSLLVQKQPGTGAIPLHVLILLPPGTEVEASEPSPTSRTGSELVYALDLKTDQVLKVILRSQP